MPVVTYAHRGASEYFPENTLRSFYAGLEMRADGIETDIQRTSDGVLVLHHDDTLERVAGEKGCIADYTYAQLLEMDFGAFKGERFEGERIGRKKLQLALEIKQPGVEAQTLQCINANGCRDKVTLTSFFWECMEAVRGLDEDISAGYLTQSITPQILDDLERLHIRQICPRVDLVDEKDMAMARARGFSVRFWGVKDETYMRRALALNGDGMTVNFPDKLTAALGK